MHQRVKAIVLLVMAGALAIATLSVRPAQAQETPPGGVIAVIARSEDGAAHLLVLDLTSGRVGQVDSAVSSEARPVWQPSGSALAFPTLDGGYGLLRSLRGCFDPTGICTDLVEVYPPFVIQQLSWSSDGAQLYFVTDQGLHRSVPRARPADITSLGPDCSEGLALAGPGPMLLCASPESFDNVAVQVLEGEGNTFAPRTTVGTFPQITALGLDPSGAAVVGTLEAAGDSGFYVPPAGSPTRLSPYQIHIYAAAFRPGALQLAVVAAIADSTGDGSLRDGDLAELFLYDPLTSALDQLGGFTGAQDIAWSPDGTQLLVITEGNALLAYAPHSQQTLPVSITLPQPDLTLVHPAWTFAEVTQPQLPLATPAAPATPIPSITPPPTLTPFVFPTLTPLPTFTPFVLPTLTPIPSATPGSPMGAGCQYAFSGTGALPVMIGDTAEVTPYGAAVRLRSAPALTGALLRELLPGTRMTVLGGPACAQGYRWWQVQLQSDGLIGYLADSDPGGFWIRAVPPIPPTPAETISFTADRLTISAGECVTIRWDVEGIKEVYYQGNGVTGHESRQECPAATTTYTLRVIRVNNSEVVQQITVFVLTP